jgi:hypothetical protein
VQLQIVCLRLWESRQGADRIGEQDVNNAVGSVDNALAGYYAEKVKAIAVGAIARGKGISEWDIRTWFERQLITEDNVRGQLRKEKNATRGLDNRVIEALIDVYLVRAEERRSITWYELAHDRLIEPIRKSNAAWMKSFKTNLPASSTAPDRVDIQEALRSTLGSSATADLEIGLHRTNDGRYVVELRLRRMDQGDLAPIRGETSLDFDALRFADNDGYGRLLSQALFADPKVRESFGMVRGAVVQAANAALRVRLFIAAGAPELHYLKWELLQDPDSGEPLLTSGTILFSRYASNYDWRPVRMRPMTDLRALVVVANPADVADDRPEGGPLSPFDVPGELARAKSELGEIPASEVTGPVTIDRLVGALRDEYDILYLVARGDWIDGEPRLWLENEEGHAEVISGSDLAKRLGELLVQPRLVILASRQHAGHGDDTLADDGGALAAMGPRLAEAGVLAVIAMQASITRATCARFFPSFFHELRRSGQIDRAMAVARVDVRDRPDYWVPVLFTRISDGRIWYVQGFSSARRREDESQTWKALVKQIEVGKCIPIIGSGLLEGLIGSIHEIARLWSEEVGSLPSPRRLEDLPQVAQYLSVMYDRYFTYQSLEKLLREQLARRFNDLPIEAALDDLLQAARVRLRDSSRMEPHDVLARLPFPLYITFNPDDQLRRALIAAGKQPILERFERGEYRDYDRPSIFDSEPSYVPTVERPLVYHMYGQLQEPDSLVLTEDDYFEHLLGLTRSQMAKRLPLSNDLDVLTVVLGALASSAKLFLGFRMENWDFAFSIRSITTFGGGNRRSKFKDVIVMREPEQNLSPNSEKAREYYERYLRGSYNLDSYVRTSHIDVYWGTVEDFLQDLGEQLLKKP